MTDPFSAAVAAAQAAQQAAGILAQENTALTQQHAADVEQHAADQATIAQLEAELHPTPTGPAWGTNIGTNQGQLAKVDAEMGGIYAARFYWGPGKGIAFPTAKQLGGDLGSRILIVSAKLTPADVLAGKWDAQITATAKACPTARPTLLCLWHEPEDDVIKRNTFTAQQFRDAFAHFAQLVHAAGNEQAMTALILMGETWNGGGGRNWRDYYPGDAAVDVMCTDEYAWGPSNPRDLTTIFAKGRAAADSVGKPFSVTETGVDAHTFTGQARYDALTLVAQRVKAVTTGPVAMYFGADPGDRWDLCTDPKALAAWKAGQKG